MSKSLSESLYRALLALLWLLGWTGATAFAQDAFVPARVTYLAGDNVYVDAGRDQGILPGDTLDVYEEGEFVGRITVVSSTSGRSVVTFAGNPFPVSLGMQLRLRTFLESGEADRPTAVAPEPPVEPEEEAAPREEGARTRQSRRRGGPRLAGRLMLSLNALQSDTKWSLSQAGDTRRTFATPSMNLHLTVSDLPQGVRLRTRLRAEYRYSSSRPIEPAFTFRSYEVLLEKSFSTFSIQTGRFSNPYAPYSGYWDGAMIHVGSKRAGFGTAVGFMPDGSSEGFSSDMPRYSGFAHFEVGDRSGLRYGAELSYNEVRPTNDLLNHRFAGFSQDLRWSGITLRSDVQLDRNPETGQWMPSRLNLRGALSPSRHAGLHGRYTIRQPYSIYRTQQVIAYRRDQAGAGGFLQLAGITVGADLALNFVENDIDGRVNDGRTVSGYLQVPKTGMLDLGLSAHASYWSAEKGNSFFLNTGVSRNLGAARTRIQYQFYRTATFADPLITHAVMLQAVLPLGGAFYTSSQVRLQRSTTLRSAALFTSLWFTF